MSVRFVMTSTGLKLVLLVTLLYESNEAFVVMLFYYLKYENL